MLQLFDDGTLDTVFCCTECGGEERYNFIYTQPEPWEPNPQSYDEFRAWAFEDAQEQHECNPEGA